MICRTQAAKFPRRPRQNAIIEFIAFTPPAIPNPPQIAITRGLRPGQFQRQQTADPQQSRLQVKYRIHAARPARM